MTKHDEALEILWNSMYFAFHQDMRLDKSAWEEIEGVIFRYGAQYVLRSDGFYYLCQEQPSLKVEAVLNDKEKLRTE